ncbi:hypothetical protein AXF42_Ash006266 [Apostasia shenzhenica]|uniref:Transposase (putative) gypsy type domain-containing protein n=1 Tax=Apostasia shenzhenica TaxID=1088818 RepID=A0A2I0AYK8_9ASPA|nr:hypothetical protein AXF42_Ash006266 [Apostasia shenzhenica]
MVKKSRSRAKDMWDDYHTLRGELCVLPPHTFETEVLQVWGRDPDVGLEYPLEGTSFTVLPKGKVAVCLHHLRGGLFLPFQPEFVNVFNHFGIVPMQLPPNAVTMIYCLAKELRRRWIPWDIEIFKAVFRWEANPCLRGCFVLKGRYCQVFKVRDTGFADWYKRFFFVELREVRFGEPRRVGEARLLGEGIGFEDSRFREVDEIRKCVHDAEDYLRELEVDVREYTGEFWQLVNSVLFWTLTLFFGFCFRPTEARIGVVPTPADREKKGSPRSAETFSSSGEKETHCTRGVGGRYFDGASGFR